MLPALRGHWDEVWSEVMLKYGTLGEAMDALRRGRKLEPEREVYLSPPDLPQVESLAAERAKPDEAIANQSSIVLLVEYADRRLLLVNDTIPTSLTAAVKGLLGERGLTELALTAFKPGPTTAEVQQPQLQEVSDEY
jgi:hypothetical protein